MRLTPDAPALNRLPFNEAADSAQAERTLQTSDVVGKQPRRASSLDPIVLNYHDDSDLYVLLVSEWDKQNRPGPRYAPDGDPFGRPCHKSENEASGHKGAWQQMCCRAHFFAKQSWVAAAFVWRKRDNLLWQVTDGGRITKCENDRDDKNDRPATAPSIESAPLGVLTAGYQGQSQDALFAAAKRENAVVFDIRFNPYSPRPEWTQAALRARFGSRYEWLGQTLGNRNYKSGGGIAIVSLDAGIERIKQYLEARKRAPILLCACKDFETCHRAVVAGALAARGIPSRELIWCGNSAPLEMEMGR